MAGSVGPISGTKRPARLVTDVPAGWNFPPVPITATAEAVHGYIAAVGAGSAVTSHDGIPLAPPAALATFCLGACLSELGLPPDAVHFAQEFEMHAPVAVGEALILHASIASKRRIGGAGRVEVALRVVDASGAVRMTGRAFILLPSGVGK